MRQISVQEALALSKEEAVLVDVRQEEEFSRGSIPGAINIPAEELEDHAELWKQDKTVYLFCHTGRKSAECVQDLEKEGKNVVDVEGGYRSYLRYSLSQFTKQEENLGERTAQIERSLIKKFRKPIWRRFTKAIKEYELIQEGDKIAVCISGGKDSMLLAKLIQEIKKHGQISFDAIFLVMNPGYNEDNWNIIQNNAKILGIPLTVFNTEIFDVVAGIEKNPCYLCARMRRGYLYSKAKELGCNKIALGHHFDDAVETFLLSLVYEGRISCFQPVTHMTRTGVDQIRPMLYAGEGRIANLAKALELPIVENPCPEDRGSKRYEIKQFIRTMSQTYPDLRSKVFGAIQRAPLDGWEKAR